MQIYLIKPRKFFTNKKLCTATSQVNLFLFILLFILLSGCSTTAHRDFEIKNLSIVSNDFQVEVSEYSAAQPSEKSLIIMPPTGGENAIDRSYARRSARQTGSERGPAKPISARPMAAVLNSHGTRLAQGA